MMNSKTMMNRIEKLWIWLPCLLRLLLVGDVGGHLRRPGAPGGRPGSRPWPAPPCMSWTSVLVRAWSKGVTEETTSSSAARLLAVISSADLTLGTAFNELLGPGQRRLVGRGERRGRLVTATTGTWVRFTEPIKGWASVAARLLGALAGRNALLLLLTWLAKEGSELTAANVPTNQTTRMNQRSRTTPRPRAPNTLSIIGPPWESGPGSWSSRHRTPSPLRPPSRAPRPAPVPAAGPCGPLPAGGAPAGPRARPR